MSVEDIREKVGAMQQGGLVVITGGEPFRQNIAWLVYELVQADDYTVQVETNGTAPPPKNFDLVCSLDFTIRRACFVVCSPKTPKIHPRLEPLVAAYKYVLSPGALSHTDGLPVEVLGNAGFKEPTHRPPKHFAGPIYVQPCDFHHPALNEHSRDTAVGVVMRHGYILQLQIHKLINME
jgi:organic radical activating enzyme